MTNVPSNPSGSFGRQKLSEISDALEANLNSERADLSYLNFRRKRVSPQRSTADAIQEKKDRPDFSLGRDAAVELSKLRALEEKNWGIQAKIAALDSKRGDRYAAALDELGRSLRQAIERDSGFRDEIQTSAYADLKLSALRARKSASEAIIKAVLAPGESDFTRHGPGWGIRTSAKFGKEGEAQVLSIIQDRTGALNAAKLVDHIEARLRAIAEAETLGSSCPLSIQVERIFPASFGGSFLTKSFLRGAPAIETKARFIVKIGQEYL